MTRAELEALISDYLDGVLGEAEAAAFEKYLPLYPDLVELVNDASEAMKALHSLETPEPPPALYARIHLSLDQVRKTAKRTKTQSSLFAEIAAFFAPVMQPRFVMGMAMTILSISMIGQLTGTRIDQVTPADLRPAAIWSSVEYRAQRIWDRAAKYYESLRVVYEMRSRVQEWKGQLEQERQRAASRLDDPETELNRTPATNNAAPDGSADPEKEKIKNKD